MKGILFDFDGVITKRSLSAYHMYQWIIQENSGYSIDDLCVEEMVQRCLFWDQFGYCDKTYVLENMKQAWFPKLDVSYWKQIWYEQFDRYQILSDNLESVLGHLRTYYKIGLLSNGNSQSQHQKLSSTGLEDKFDSITISGDYGIDKPDPRIFKIACKNLGTNCDETIMVGDTFFTDISGALKSGLFPIWYCYDRKPVSEYNGVVIVHNMKELESYLLRDENEIGSKEVWKK